MRHPAAPTLIAILLGFLLVVILYHAFVNNGHHEGNPHPDDVPVNGMERRNNEIGEVGGEDGEDDSGDGKED
jgi:hypothetical protein